MELGPSVTSIFMRSQIGKRSMPSSVCESMCVLRERRRDNADSGRGAEGDPLQLLLPVSPPDIDPCSSTQIRLKDTQIHGLLDISNMAGCKL